MITRTFDLLDHLVTNYPKDDILAGKSGGEWVRYSSHDYYKYAHYLAYGLCEKGFKQGDKIITMATNCPEWNFIDMAMAMCGIIHVPIYPTLTTENYLHILKHSEAKAIFVSSKVLLRRIMPAIEQLKEEPGQPSLEIYTLSAIEGYHPMIEILKAGIANHDQYLNIIEERKMSIKPDDWATLIYTSGTTGDPKGVMLSHKNLCSNFVAHAGVNYCMSDCKFLSFLPLNHAFERSMNYHYQYRGISIYYAESMGTIVQNMAEIKADGFCAVPRVLEMIYDKLYAAGKDLEGIKKKIYNHALSHGARYDDTLLKKVSLWYQIKQRFYDKFVYSQWRERLGGKNLTIICGGSSIQTRLIRILAAAGLHVHEGYGLSETSPVIAVNNPVGNMTRIGTVGPALAGTEMRIAEDGEILTRGPHVMMGYYKDPEATSQIIDADGWLHTGDIGELVNGKYLRITDRKKDIFKLSAGKYIAPQIIENKLRESEYVEQAMVVGANEKFAAAIIAPNFNTLHYWALKHKLHYRDNADLITQPQVLTKFQEIIDKYNPNFAAHEQIKKFKLVADDWTTASGLLSPTLKLKRNILSNKYKELIQDIYGHTEASAGGILSAFRGVELPSILKTKNKE